MYSIWAFRWITNFFSSQVQAEIKKSWSRRTLALDFKRKARSGSNTYSYGPMVSHTSVTNVTARAPLALHLTTRLGPVPVNGHRNLPGYVKNGSVSENSIPSSGQELHIPDEEHSAPTRPCEDQKPSSVVEEERETVMWPLGLLQIGRKAGGKKQIMKQSQDSLKGMAACINTAIFFLLWIDPEHCQLMRLKAKIGVLLM